MAAQGQRRCSAEYLRHWYFRTPSSSASVILGEALGRLVGMATTNDHRFVTAGADGLVGMPQKVLTDSALRGQGIFGKQQLIMLLMNPHPDDKVVNDRIRRNRPVRLVRSPAFVRQPRRPSELP